MDFFSLKTDRDTRMSYSMIVNHSFKRVFAILAVLAILLPSANAMADSTTVPVNETAQANRAVQPNQPIQRKYSNAVKPKRPDTHRVYKDDYERLLIKANKAEPPPIIWLREHQAKPRKAQTAESWLADRGRTE